MPALQASREVGEGLAFCVVAAPSNKSDKHCCTVPVSVSKRKRCCAGWQESKESKTGAERESTQRALQREGQK